MKRLLLDQGLPRLAEAISGERGPSMIRIRKQGLDAVTLAALLQGIWAARRSTLFKSIENELPAQYISVCSEGIMFRPHPHIPGVTTKYRLRNAGSTR